MQRECVGRFSRFRSNREMPLRRRLDVKAHLPIAVLLAAVFCGPSFAAAGPGGYGVLRMGGGDLMVWDQRVELGMGSHSIDEHSLQMIKDLGIRLVRYTMYWDSIEAGREKLNDWDKDIARCERMGMHLVIVVHRGPPELVFANREEGYRRFAEFMAKMAARYQYVRYWELWNEMDVDFTDLFGAFQKDVPMRQRGKYYAEMLRLAYPAIKRANPKAFVLTGGMSDCLEFPTGIYEGGGKDYFDIMNIHTYGLPIVWAFIGRGLAARQVMEDHGDADKPLWNTEFGIDAGNIIRAWGIPDVKDHGKYLDDTMIAQWKECLDAARRYRLYQKVLPYQFHAESGGLPEETKAKLHLPEGNTIDDYGYGIVRRDGKTPRPVYDWLKHLAFNRALLACPRKVLDVETAPQPGLQPEGVAHSDYLGERLVLKGFEVDSLYPSVVKMAAAQ